MDPSYVNVMDPAEILGLALIYALHGAVAASLPAAADQREVQLTVGGCGAGLGARQD